MGREPAKGTINKHNIVIRAVFDFTIQQKLCLSTDVPKHTIKKKGRKSERRGHFISDECNEHNDLMKFMEQWKKDASTFTSKHKRSVLQAYVIFMDKLPPAASIPLSTGQSWRGDHGPRHRDQFVFDQRH